MKLLTKALEKKLRANSKLVGGRKKAALKPVVKFFTPDAGFTWLFTELDDDNLFFGLADAGIGYPELGYVSMDELESVRGVLGLPVERDRWWKAEKTLDEYANEANATGRIAA